MSATQDLVPDFPQRKLTAEIDKLQAETRLLKRPWLDPNGVLIPFLGAVIGLGSCCGVCIRRRHDLEDAM